MSKKKQIAEKIIVLSLAAVVIALLVFFLKDIFFPILRLEIAQDFEGAKQLITSKGVLGGMTVVLVEALQMVVIFIPAEFIQISSGISYPWYIALLLCDLGVVLGASVIYFIVHVFKFDGDIFSKTKKISKYEKKSDGSEKSVMILMYFLFVMPIIPFGAICYYSSNKKIRYPRYVFTCATGVIPSILTSNVMGFGIRQFISDSIPLWILILIIIGAAALLFVLILFILNKFYFKQNKGTPDSPYYTLMTKAMKMYLAGRVKVKVVGERLSELYRGGYLMLSNHGSFPDFYYALQANPDRRACTVFNSHYFQTPVIGTAAKNCGFIPKKLFYTDFETIKGIYRAKAQNLPIIMFPEGRLSNDGGPSPINPSVATLAKKLDIPLVLTTIDNSYLSKPKWRKKMFRTTVFVNVRKIVQPEELREMDKDTLFALIKDTLSFNDFHNGIRYKNKGKAEGLDNLLYLCPHCGSLYTTVAHGNRLECTACGEKLDINEFYKFENAAYADITEYYAAMMAEERKHLDGLDLQIETEVKIFRQNSRKYDKEKGVFRLNEKGVSFKSNVTDYAFQLTVGQLERIAYSVDCEFELYYDNRLHYFYPTSNKKICTRVALLYDLLKEREENENT